MLTWGMARKAKDEIEVVFGFKQVLGLALVSVLVLGGAFVWGFEVGHQRATRGEPSLLTFLEESADPLAEPVSIPDVLLTDPTETPGPATAPQTAESGQASDAPPPPERADLERIKPNPGVQAQAGDREAGEVAEPAAPAPVPALAAVAPDGSRQRLHYQVGAHRVPDNAKQFVDWLRSEGLPARIQAAGSDGIYRVYVGPFRTAEEAASAKAQLVRDGFQPMVRMF